MNIIIVGYGKMGKMVEAAAKQRGHTIVSIIDRHSKHQQISAEAVEGGEVCIDFTHPESAIHNIKAMAALGKNMVIGTTGWYDRVDEVKKIIEAHHVGCLYSPNFSIGVNLFIKIVGYAAQLINEFDDYDVAGMELHHNKKADSPSGTAIAIANALKEKVRRKKTILYDTSEGQIPADTLHFPSVRVGSTPGTHSTIFDSPADTITLTHQARSREGFAMGAVLAAEWLKNKKGLFTMEDLLK